ncbi:MAG: hypothetical protein ACJ71T_02250 [Actinomycetales bacterium]
MSVRQIAVAVPVVLLLGIPLSASAASASSGSSKGGDGVRAAGSCSSGGTWKLKAKHDDARIDVEAEVDTNRVGQTWSWRISDNGVQVASGTAKTVAPSGSFTVERRIANRAGADRMALRATNAATGQVCTGTVSLA